MRCAALLVGLLLVTSVAPSVGGATPPPEISDPTVEFHVYLQPDGDARWEVRMQFGLDSENETAAFREYADRFEAGETNVGPPVSFFESAAASASRSADREMRIANVTRDASLDEDGGTGTLRLRFVWTSFLADDGDRYVLQDALMTGDDETWLRSLGADQSLRIYTPDGYDIDEASRARQVNDSLVIDGPTSYEDERFRIVYGRTSGGPGTTTASPSETTPGSPDLGGVVLGAALLVGLATLGVWFWQRRRDEGPADRPGRPDDGAGTAAGAAEDGPDGPPAGGDGTAAVPAVDPELLSDEERVERLLERNGGRMRQAAIVTETDWSDAKVSQLLSRMAEEGRVEKLRLGRENLISLPDAEARNGEN